MGWSISKIGGSVGGTAAASVIAGGAAGPLESTYAAVKGSDLGAKQDWSKLSASGMTKEMKSWSWDDVERASVNIREGITGETKEDKEKAKAELEAMKEEMFAQARSGLIDAGTVAAREEKINAILDQYRNVDVTSETYKKVKDAITVDKIDAWKAKAVQIGKAAEMEAASILSGGAATAAQTGTAATMTGAAVTGPSLGAASQMTAAQLSPEDKARAQQLLDVAAAMRSQLDQSVKMTPADFETYLKTEAQKIGAPPDVSLDDIIVSDASNFVQIGSNPEQAANLQNIMQTSAANITQATVDWDKQSLAARDEARATGQSVLQSLQTRMQGPTITETAAQQRALTEQAQKNIASQFASQRGQANPAMQREMLRQQAAAAQTVAGQQNLAATQETQRRQEALAGIAGAQQAQQFQEATQPALTQQQLAQQTAIAQAQLQQQALGQTSSQTAQAILQQAQLEEAARQQAATQAYSGSTLTAEQQQNLWLQQMQMAQQQATQVASLQQEAAKGNQAAALQLAQMSQGAQTQQYLTQADLAKFQTGYQQEAAAANQAAANQFALQQAQLQQQAKLATAGYAQEASSANQAALNQFLLQQSAQQQQANMLTYQTEAQRLAQNAAYQQQANQQNASNQLQIQLANQAAQQQMMQTGVGAEQFNVGLSEQQNQFAAQQAQQNIQNQMAMQQFWQNQLAQSQAAQQQNVQTNAALQSGLTQSNLQSQTAENIAEKQAKASGVGSLLGAGGTAIAGYFASDKRSKENIKNLNKKDLNEFFAAIKAKEYDYKDPNKHGQGKHAGFLTQQVKNKKLGKELISTDPETGYDMVNAVKLLGILTAQVANLTKKATKDKK